MTQLDPSKSYLAISMDGKFLDQLWDANNQKWGYYHPVVGWLYISSTFIGFCSFLSTKDFILIPFEP